MTHPSWDDLAAWADRDVPQVDLQKLAYALSEGPSQFLATLSSLVAPSETSGPFPAALAVLFWKLHGVPFNESVYHQQLLAELSAHLQPVVASLTSVLEPGEAELVSQLGSIAPMVSDPRQQVAACSDVLVSSGLASRLPLEDGPSEDAAAAAWLAQRLAGESVVSCHLSPGRHERISSLLGERSELWVLGASRRALPLYASEALSDDEVHLVGEDESYLELFLPPAPIRSSSLLSSIYSEHRAAGLAPLQALSLTLS